MPRNGRSSDVNLVPTLLGVSVALLVCATVLIIGLAGRPAGGLTLPTGYQIVHVDEVNFGFRLASPTLTAGNTVFVVANGGTVPHEFVLFKTDLQAAKLPLLANKSVNESSSALADVADSGSSLAPGETRLVTTNLVPGHYALVCNLPGHYQLGMSLDVTVK